MRRYSIFMAPEGAPPAGSPPTPGTPPPAAPPQSSTPPAPAPTPAPPTPEEISVKWPEGFKADEKLSTQFLSIMKDGKLNGSQRAQSLADLYVSGIQSVEAQRAEKVIEWAAEAKKTLGDKFDATTARAKSIVDRVAPEGFKKMLSETGLGNHVEFISLFAKLGDLIAEDRLGPKPTPGGEKSRYELLKEAFPASPGMWGTPPTA